MVSKSIQRYEEEKSKLINNVANAFKEYENVIYKELENLNNIIHRTMSNSFDRPPSLSEMINTNVDIDVKENLANDLNYIKQGYHYVEDIKNSFENFHNKFMNLKQNIEDLEHFYYVAGDFLKERSKIKMLKRCLKPLTEGTSDKADLKPLLSLDRAYSCIDSYNEHKELRFVDNLLLKDSEGNYTFDKNGYYIVNTDFFISQIRRLKSNIQNKYEINAKAVRKVTRKHNTSDRLKRFLEFGR